MSILAIETILDPATLAALRAAERGTCEVLEPAPFWFQVEGLSNEFELSTDQLAEIKAWLLDPRCWTAEPPAHAKCATAAWWLSGPAGEVAVSLCTWHSHWIIIGPSKSTEGGFEPVHFAVRRLIASFVRESMPSPYRVLSQREEDLIERVRRSFRGVTLGKGIGLLQANGIDDYADEKQQAVLRKQDEKHNWEALRAEDLNRYHWSIGYFDAAGLRFHLPAYLVAELQGTLTAVEFFSFLFHPGWVAHLLNEEQRDVVRDFFRLQLGDPNYDQDRVKRALVDWSNLEKAAV